MELVIDKIKARIEKDTTYSINDLSKEELMTLWYEEGHSDEYIARLFNISVSKVSSTRKRKNVMLKFISEENREKKAEIWYFQHETIFVKKRKMTEMKRLFQNTEWLLGAFNVFCEEAKWMQKKETTPKIYSKLNDNSFTYDYTICIADYTFLSFAVSFFEQNETFRIIYTGKDYAKSTRDTMWAFFQFIVKKIKKLGFENVAYFRLPEANRNQEVDIEKLGAFKEDMKKDFETLLNGMDEDFIDLYTNSHHYQWIHYLGELKNLTEFGDLFEIKEIAEQHYALTIQEAFLAGKTNKEHYLFYEKIEILLGQMNLCVFSEIIQHGNKVD